MDNPSNHEIRVEGFLSDRCSDWFEGLEIRNNPNGDTILTGWFLDQPLLFGTLTKIQALNLRLLSVIRPAQPGWPSNKVGQEFTMYKIVTRCLTRKPGLLGYTVQ
jgi:hypothetical protein